MNHPAFSPPRKRHRWKKGDRARDPLGRLCEVRHIERIREEHDIFAVSVEPYWRITVAYLDGGAGNNLRPEDLELVEA